MRAAWALAVVLLMLIVGSCGLAPSEDVEDINPLTLPQRLLATPAPSSPTSGETNRSDASVYFLRDTTLQRASRTVAASAGPAALQELLNNLAAGPDAFDRRRGLSSALPPTTRLTVTRLEGDLATVDLAVGQTPPNQTTAIAQIVLTATSLPEVDRVLLTFDGKPLQAPLANGAQTDRPLTRADYASLLTSS